MSAFVGVYLICVMANTMNIMHLFTETEKHYMNSTYTPIPRLNITECNPKITTKSQGYLPRSFWHKFVFV